MIKHNQVKIELQLSIDVNLNADEEAERLIRALMKHLHSENYVESWSTQVQDENGKWKDA